MKRWVVIYTLSQHARNIGVDMPYFKQGHMFVQSDDRNTVLSLAAVHVQREWPNVDQTAVTYYPVEVQ